jgi:hypothetical protein
MTKMNKYRKDVYRAIKQITKPEFTLADIMSLIDWPELCVESMQAAARDVVREMVFLQVLSEGGRPTEKVYAKVYFDYESVPNPYIELVS